MPKKVGLSVYWLLLVLPLALVACGPTPEPSIMGGASHGAIEATHAVAAEEANTPTTKPEPAPTLEVRMDGLWYPLDGEPDSLDIQSGQDRLIIDQCIEGLFEYRGDGSIEPTGATGFEVSEDGRVYTIHLSPEAVWSDGQGVVAQHFVDGLIRLLRPETEADYARSVYDIEGAEAFNTGQISDPAKVGVRAVDDLTLEIRLGGPAAYFEALLPLLSFYPVRLDSIEAHGERWTEPGNYLCNGPYLVDAWQHGEKVVLVKNPVYWNADQVQIDEITLPIILDAVETMARYESGELHATGRVSLVDDAQRILADSVLRQELRVLPRPGLLYIGLNTRRLPTDDVRVRQALIMAFDRTSFIEEHVWWPNPSPLSCSIPPTVAGYQPNEACGYGYDPERARSLLAEAGYPGGEGFPTLHLWANWTDFREKITMRLAEAWEEILGVTTEVHLNDWGFYLDYLDKCNMSQEDLAACELNAYVQAWVMDHGDAQNLLEALFAPDSPLQYTGWESDRYQEWLDLARTEPDTALRAEYYKEADRILSQDEAVILPVVSFQWTTMVKEGVTFEYPPFGDPKFKHWALPQKP